MWKQFFLIVGEEKNDTASSQGVLIPELRDELKTLLIICIVKEDQTPTQSCRLARRGLVSTLNQHSLTDL